ncbi:MFS transporter [Streptomyces sp. NPDC053367]|uniref:MFS transporter n=1 Tax=Streptomyces sp. NPDC053367 TaxID=3365700 RepID=UPI0037D38586
MTSTVHVLRHPQARLLLTATLISGFGTSALWLASGIWVKDLTGSNGLAALCLLAMWAPGLAGPALGTLADRVPRKPLLIATNLLLGALLTTLTGIDSPADLWLLLTLLVLYGTAGVVTDAAESALVAGSLPPALLGDFNGLRMTANEGMKLLAPLAGAALYSTHGGPAVAVLDSATCLAAAALHTRLNPRTADPTATPPPTPTPTSTPAPRTPWRAQIAEGTRHLRRHALLHVLVRTAGLTMLIAGVNGALTYAVVENLHHAPAYAGTLAAAQGAGTVALGLFSGRALRRLGARRFAAAGVALTAAAIALRAIPSDPAALACAAATGVGLPCPLVAAFTTVQRETPDALLGRVSATASTLMFAPNVVGLAAGAALVELLPLGPLLIALGVTLLAALAHSPLIARRTASRSPSDANPT